MQNEVIIVKMSKMRKFRTLYLWILPILALNLAACVKNQGSDFEEEFSPPGVNQDLESSGTNGSSAGLGFEGLAKAFQLDASALRAAAENYHFSPDSFNANDAAQIANFLNFAVNSNPLLLGQVKSTWFTINAVLAVFNDTPNTVSVLQKMNAVLDSWVQQVQVFQSLILSTASFFPGVEISFYTQDGSNPPPSVWEVIDDIKEKVMGNFCDCVLPGTYDPVKWEEEGCGCHANLDVNQTIDIIDGIARGRFLKIGDVLYRINFTSADPQVTSVTLTLDPI
jgi:hypothetical protein